MLERNIEIGNLLDYYGVLLTERQREIADLYHNEDFSLAEVAEHTGISRQGVRDSLIKSEALLYEYEEKLKLVYRFTSIDNKLTNILLALKELKLELSDSQIKNRIGDIISMLSDISSQDEM